LLMLPGHATFRHLSRYSPYHERTFSRWYDTSFDWVSFNKIAITEVVSQGQPSSPLSMSKA
jgi:hypothetical protein